jgi:hypothetical protein
VSSQQTWKNLIPRTKKSGILGDRIRNEIISLQLFDWVMMKYYGRTMNWHIFRVKR